MKVVIIIFIIIILGFGIFLFFNQKDQTLDESLSENENGQEGILNNNVENIENNFSQEPIQSEVVWEFSQESKEWSVKGKPPECLEPLVFPSPSNVKLASGILYPGQVRGGDYKPHGGIRFDDLKNNELDVYAPMDGRLFKAARHLDEGEEVQYALYFINDCGIMYKLDHLRELTDKFNDILNTIPMGAKGDSRTTEIKPSVFVEKGERIATKVGYEFNKNVAFDFGVYDFRKKNGVVYSSEFRAKHLYIDELGPYALCWLNYLVEEDKIIVKGLPAADGIQGKTSDYCK